MQFRDPVLKKQLQGLYPLQPPEQSLKIYYEKELKRIKLGIILGLLILMLALVAAWTGRQLKDGGLLERNAPGKGSYYVSLEAQVGDRKQTMDVEVQEQRWTDEEVELEFQKARDYIDQCIGEEKRIQEDLDLPDQSEDGYVSIAWTSDNYDVVDGEGRIVNPQAGGSTVRMEAQLACQQETCIYEFYLKVFPRELTDEELLKKQIQDAVSMSQEETAQEGALTLPDSVEGENLSWREPWLKGIPMLGLLGMVVAVLLVLAGRDDLKNRYSRREEQLLIDYPVIVNKLSLLIGAGMTITGAWGRILQDYEGREGRYAYDEMYVCYRHIQDGSSEKQAYEDFGKRCGLRQYLKLSSLITQNISKGADGLTGLLKAEAEEAFRERKDTARQKGEEAGTKLLGPMMILLVVVMVIVMAPGFMSFQI